MKGLLKYIGKTIEIYDRRAGVSYPATINDVRRNFGSDEIQLVDNGPWFQPTKKEWDSVKIEAGV